jgi:hypothetical protein
LIILKSPLGSTPAGPAQLAVVPLRVVRFVSSVSSLCCGFVLLACGGARHQSGEMSKRRRVFLLFDDDIKVNA